MAPKVVATAQTDELALLTSISTKHHPEPKGIYTGELRATGRSNGSYNVKILSAFCFQ